jgi:hypothetical protein
MDTAVAPSTAVRVLEGVLRAFRWILIIATPILLVLGVVTVIGVGSVSVRGSTETVRPVQLQPGEYQVLVDGRPVDVAETTLFESNDGNVRFGKTDVTIGLSDNARSARLAAIALAMLWLVLAWVGVGNLHAIARSTLRGDAFTTVNSQRLRRLGFATVAYPCLTLLGQMWMRHSVQSLKLAGPAVVVDVGVPQWWAWVVVGLFFFVVAEVFAHGVELRELDRTTI